MEKHLEAKLRRKVKSLGGECLKWTSPPLRGAPDRIIFLPDGRVIFVETKFGKNGPSAQQLKFHSLLHAQGQHVWLIGNEEQLQEFLKEL